MHRVPTSAVLMMGTLLILRFQIGDFEYHQHVQVWMCDEGANQKQICGTQLHAPLC